MKLALETAKELMETNGGNLYLRGTQITALPDNLTVGGWLDLSGTQITALPDNLTVGGSLYLRGTQITDTALKKIKQLSNGDYVPGRYLYCDNILTHIKKEKRIQGFVFFVGKIKGYNVISDGKNFAHCDKARDGIADLLFKSAKDRGADQYRGMSLDTALSVPDAVTMYRVITGACKQGSETFVNSFGGNLKERYTIREILELTKGQYGSENLSRFFVAAL